MKTVTPTLNEQKIGKLNADFKSFCQAAGGEFDPAAGASLMQISVCKLKDSEVQLVFPLDETDKPLPNAYVLLKNNKYIDQLKSPTILTTQFNIDGSVWL